jgi:hypothetical protein
MTDAEREAYLSSTNDGSAPVPNNGTTTPATGRTDALSALSKLARLGRMAADFPRASANHLGTMAMLNIERFIEDNHAELAQGAVIAQRMATEKPCPTCGEALEYMPRREAERETGCAAWPGGWTCGCGYEKLDDRGLAED